MTLTDILTEFFGVVPIRAAIERELPSDDLVVVVSSIGRRRLLTRQGLCQRGIAVTAYFRIRTMQEIEITEMLYHSFNHYRTEGRWQWKDVEITYGEASLKTGNPQVVPFYISFDLFYLS